MFKIKKKKSTEEKEKTKDLILDIRIMKEGINNA